MQVDRAGEIAKKSGCEFVKNVTISRRSSGFFSKPHKARKLVIYGAIGLLVGIDGFR